MPDRKAIGAFIGQVENNLEIMRRPHPGLEMGK